MAQAPQGTPLLAQVAVSDATIYYDKLYTYQVPTHLEGHIFVGSMVLVPFGRGQARPRVGVVMEIGHSGDVPPRMKPLWDAAPQEAGLPEELLAIVKWLKETTFCTWFEAVRAVLPRGAQYSIQNVEGGWLLQPKLERLYETVYALADGEDTGTRKLTAKQQAVLHLLACGPLSRSELCETLGVTDAVAKGLVARGLLLETERDKQAVEDYSSLPRWAEGQQETAVELSLAQKEVFEGLAACLEAKRPKPALLYGITGSGKTLIFIKLIQKVLEQGKTALVLVPEIGLTGQMLGALQAAFGKEVAVQHSGLSATQRVLQWRAVQRGEARVVVGTRSAVFAPLDEIGLIVIDEEQEHTYQSESAPRYDAIEVARGRAARHGALLLLASATPSITSFYMAEKKRYNLFYLRERFGNLPLPQVEMVDMAAELSAGNAGALSRQLLDAMASTIAQGNQVILLLNRRGYHRVALCRDCGEAVQCCDCSVPMVFHKTAQTQPNSIGLAGHLVCHYCGKTQEPAPEICPSCGGSLRYTGFGTQRLEEELAQYLPNARILRMDMDTTARKGSHAALLQRFSCGDADVLLGTQMVAKGLDFEKVKLVGVVGIDSLLFGQGYRAFEQVFALVTQVVGRSGRSGSPGRAIIQTVDVNHPVLRLAAAQDYEAFYEEESGFRSMALYPPYCTLCVAGFVSAEEESARDAARLFGKMLVSRAKAMENIPLRILGPAPMQVVKQAGAWRYKLTIKCRGDAAFRVLAWQALEDYNKSGLPKTATVFLDFHMDG